MSTIIINSEDSITVYLQNVTSEELIELWNRYCLNDTKADQMIYDNDSDFFEALYCDRPHEAVRVALKGRYTYEHKFATINRQGNIDSSNDASEICDLSELARFIQAGPSYFPEITLMRRSWVHDEY